MTQLPRRRPAHDTQPLVVLKALWFAGLSLYLLVAVGFALWERVPEGVQVRWTGPATAVGLALLAGGATLVLHHRRTPHR